MIELIGGSGRMGSRYRAILEYLHVPYMWHDNRTDMYDILNIAANSDAIIIATPTYTHHSFLKHLLQTDKPILCEKPIATDVDERFDIFNNYPRCNLTMMMQYMMLDDEKSNGLTYYNYYNHGTDGLNFDCIQLIALGRQYVVLDETSPIWRCTLNGVELSLSQMDKAYIDYVSQWLMSPGQDLNYLKMIHINAAQWKR